MNNNEIEKGCKAIIKNIPGADGQIANGLVVTIGDSLDPDYITGFGTLWEINPSFKTAEGGTIPVLPETMLERIPYDGDNKSDWEVFEKSVGFSPKILKGLEEISDA